jgi:hypothetical protein
VGVLGNREKGTERPVEKLMEQNLFKMITKNELKEIHTKRLEKTKHKERNLKPESELTVHMQAI